MHLYQSKLRAIETGRYVLRAGNTGISCIISDKGDVACEIGALKEGYFVRDVYSSNHRTLYSYIGNTFVYLLIALVLYPFAEDMIIKIREKKKE